MNRQAVSRGRRQNEFNVKDRYAQAYKRYVQSQFTYNSQCLLRKLCQNGQKQPKLYNIPLYKIMIQISKIMMMNQLQLLFFGATIQQMGWKVPEPCLAPYTNQLIDITPKISKENFQKRVQLSLLLISYIVKIYLNQDSSLYDYRIRDLIKNNFDKMYQEWVQKVQNNFKFSPKHMNRLFKQLDKGKNKTNQQIIDYNHLVAELFKNSPDEERNYLQQRPIPYRQEKQKQYRQGESILLNTKKTLGLPLPVHEYQQQLYPIPSLDLKGVSQKSQIPGFGRKQSINQLFQKGQMKPDEIYGFHRNYSQDGDFLGSGNL